MIPRAPIVAFPSSHMFRDDYVTQSNDSHWLTNPAQPLEGYSRVFGSERTTRSLRTRMGLKLVQERLAGTDGLSGTKFDLDAAVEAATVSRALVLEGSADCMNGGWPRYVQPTFKNQGECVSYFSTFRGGVSK